MEDVFFAKNFGFFGMFLKAVQPWFYTSGEKIFVN